MTNTLPDVVTDVKILQSVNSLDISQLHDGEILGCDHTGRVFAWDESDKEPYYTGDYILDLLPRKDLTSSEKKALERDINKYNISVK